MMSASHFMRLASCLLSCVRNRVDPFFFSSNFNSFTSSPLPPALLMATVTWFPALASLLSFTCIYFFPPLPSDHPRGSTSSLDGKVKTDPFCWPGWKKKRKKSQLLYVPFYDFHYFTTHAALLHPCWLRRIIHLRAPLRRARTSAGAINREHCHGNCVETLDGIAIGGPHLEEQTRRNLRGRSDECGGSEEKAAAFRAE